MNRFKKLASRLLQNKLWCSEIIYVVTQPEQDGPGLPIVYGDISRKMMKVIIKSVSKNLVDNVNILNTDSSFTIDVGTLIPKPQDYIVIGQDEWKIVAIIPLGIINNEPTLHEVVMRLA